MIAAMNLDQHADKSRVVAEVLLSDGWDTGEISRACGEILRSAELMQVIRFAGAVTPEVFVRYREMCPRPRHNTCAVCGETVGLDTITADGIVYHGDCYGKRKA